MTFLHSGTFSVFLPFCNDFSGSGRYNRQSSQEAERVMHVMKIHWLYGICLSSILTAACGLPDAPTDLLRAPAQDVQQETITHAVMTFLPAGAHLTVPRRPESASAIHMKDLDGDGQEEIAAFFQTEKTNYEIGVLILVQSDGEWHRETVFTGVGTELDYVLLEDVTSDRTAELLLGLSGGEELNRELTVYSLKERQPMELMKQPYSELDVGDVNGDAIPEIVLLHHDRSQLRAKAELYGSRDGSVARLAAREMDGSAVYEQILIGQAFPQKNGVFVDASIGAHAAYTSLLVWENGQLRDVFETGERENMPTWKPYPLRSEDINQDGIVEIGIHRRPAGTDHLPAENIPWIASYYQWDGKKGLWFAEEHFQSYEHGFDFVIPDKWTGRYTVEQRKVSDTVEVVFLYRHPDSGKTAELLTLKSMPKQEWSRLESSSPIPKGSYTVLAAGAQTITAAFQPVRTAALSDEVFFSFQQLLLTHEEIRKRFKRLRISG